MMQISSDGTRYFVISRPFILGHLRIFCMLDLMNLMSIRLKLKVFRLLKQVKAFRSSIRLMSPNFLRFQVAGSKSFRIRHLPKSNQHSRFFFPISVSDFQMN